MGITLQRKDNTSIFCNQSFSSKNSYSTKNKIIGLFISLSLMTIGMWIILNFS
jgi:hypothetical protein